MSLFKALFMTLMALIYVQALLIAAPVEGASLTIRGTQEVAGALVEELASTTGRDLEGKKEKKQKKKDILKKVRAGEQLNPKEKKKLDKLCDKKAAKEKAVKGC